MLHPLLLPVVGVASHLLWWVHVLPVALVTYGRGRRAGALAVGASTLLLVGGERLFGAGYWNAADWATVLSLAAALCFTHLLVVGFALHARRVSRRYQLLFDRAEIGILRTDEEGRVLAANPAAVEILGVDDEKVKGRKLPELSVMRDLPPPGELEASGGWSGKVEVPSGEGARVAHLVAAAVSQGEPAGHQILLMDRTSEVVHEQELERQTRLATLGEALAGVAHELKNPLSVILAYSQMVRDDEDEDPEELRDMIRAMGEQGERMHTLVQELLGYSRPPDPSECVPLHTLLERLLRMEMVARGRAVRFQNRIEWEGDEAVIEVADDGPGIDPEIMDRIFQPFVTTKGPEKGTGLGLAISRRLAGAMGGSLTARNRLAGGAAFQLRLPLEPSGTPLDQPAVQESETSSQPSSDEEPSTAVS